VQRSLSSDLPLLRCVLQLWATHLIHLHTDRGQGNISGRSLFPNFMSCFVFVHFPGRRNAIPHRESTRRRSGISLAGCHTVQYYKRFLTLYRTQERTQLCRHVRISTNTRFHTVYFRFTGGVRSGHLAETLTVPLAQTFSPSAQLECRPQS
jgi:hypothetical protein